MYIRQLHNGAVIARNADGGAGSAPPAGQQQQQAPTGGAPPAGQQQQQAPTGAEWFAKLSADPDMKAWAESKGWKDAASADPFAVAQSYHNLEKLFGADKAGRTVQLPKDASDTAALDAVFKKLGKPESAEGYKIELPEGADPTFANAARNWFHKANLTADQAKAVTDSYRAMELDAAQKVETQHASEVEGLQREWGADFDKKVETAKAAAKAAGMQEDHVKRLELALGPASATKILEFFGRNYVEAGPPGNETRTKPGFESVTPAAAKQKMDQLRADPNFMARYENHDPKVRAAAIQEMDDLAKLAVNTRM